MIESTQAGRERERTDIWCFPVHGQRPLAVDFDGMRIDQILPAWCSSALDF